MKLVPALSLPLVLSLAACGGAREASIGPLHADIPVPGQRAAAETAKSGPKESPPAPLASRESPFPKVLRTRLANGLSVETVEARALPLVQLRVLIRAGNGYGGTPGVAKLTAELLKDGGARGMSSAELLRRVETLGATLTVDVDFDATRLGLAVTNDELPQALDLVAAIVREPAFDEKELLKLKAREKDQADDNARSSGTWMATRVLFRELYTQENPYSSFDVVPSEIARINGLTIRDFHRRFYVPKNVDVVLAGDIDGSAAAKAVEKSFGDWKGGDPPKVSFPPAIPLAKTRVVVVNRPKSTQSDVFVASLIADRKTPDWPAIRVANQILGGVPAGRLFLDVREQRSLAYSTTSRVIELANGPEPLVISAGTQTPKTAEAVDGLLDNVRKIAGAPVSVAETESARRYLSDVFAIRMETIGSIADMVVLQDALGLPDGYWDTYRAEVRATVPETASAAAHKIFHADPSLIVVSGDADAIGATLTRFGEVAVIDPEHDFQTLRTLPAEPASR